jgi:hypothetical protein
MAVVVFDKVAFLARYPEFVATDALYPSPADIITASFNEACVILDNRDCSRVPVPPRDTLLNMLTAHIVAIYFGIDGKPPSRAVGRVASAGQGSVNVSLAMGPATDQKAWYEQTIYGASYWRASMGYRSMLIVPPCPAPEQIYLQEG